MLILALYLPLAALLAFFMFKYRKTGDAKHLKSASSIVFVVIFFSALQAAVYAVLYPGKQWLPYFFLFSGCVIGGLLLARTYQGWRKIYALGQTILFLAVTSVLTSSMAYFEKVIVYNYSERAATRAVPGSALMDIRHLSGPQKAAMVMALADALSSQDRYVRIGAINKLSGMGQEAASAVPALIPLIETSDQDTLAHLANLLRNLGPSARDASPALSARLAGTKDFFPRFSIESALKAVTVSTATAR
jgi:hypothetical protein